MRVVGKDERKKRGCLYCLDSKKNPDANGRMCKHKECPYRELDEYETYEDFFEAQDCIFDVLFRSEE